MAYSDRRLWMSREIDLETTGDYEMHFAPLNRVVIHKIAIMPTSADAGGAGCTFERRRVASTDATIEVVTVPAANHQGDVIFTEILAGYTLVPGDRLNIAGTQASGTGPTAIALMEYSIDDMDLSDGTTAVVIESA